MKPKRLSLDTKKLEQPQDTYPFGKNGVWNSNIGAVENENGFKISAAILPYKLIGVIETDVYPVYFSTDNVNSAFGFHDIDNDVYVPIFDDAAKAFKLNFSLDRPIKGEYRRNFRNEIELTWLEIAAAGANPPRWANTVRIGTDPNDFLLFPKSLIPYIETSIQSGGNLGMGSYFIGLKYVRNDGTQTRYTTLTRPLIAYSDNYDTIPGSNTGKALNITITGIDTTYERVGLVVVERINGIDTAYELPELTVAPTITFIYTGSEKQQILTMEEVLIPSAYYENAQAITQLSDQLFLGNMTEEKIIDWQQYASMINIRWKSEITNVSAKPVNAVDSGKQRGFMHEEVYAFYAVLKLRNGRNSRAFTIPGPAPLSSDLVQSTIATAQGITNTPVYAIEETSRNIQPDKTGNCGIWVNLDETYPDIPQFDSSAIGGPNLRNQPVRHHKMPSIRFCKQNLYGSNAEYGRTQLDTLGLEVTNVIIPASLQNDVIGWEIHYAKRDFNNALVLGQSLAMFGAQPNQDMASGGNITSTGGNWGSWQRTRGSGAKTDPEALQIVNNYIRLHAFDLLYFRPSITPTHLSLQLYEQVNNPGIAVGNANEVIYGVDYTNGAGTAVSPVIPTAANHIYKVTNGQYVVNNNVAGDFSNIRLEDAYAVKLPTPSSALMNPAGWTWTKRDYTNGNNDYPQFELTYLTNLMTIRRNVYINYFSQTLVRTGNVFPSTLQSSNLTVYGGDVYVSRYEFITYGLVTRKDIVSDTGIQDWKTADTDGIKAVHSFICETVGNIATRYEIPGNAYSKFTPKSVLAGVTNTFLYGFSRAVNPNQIGYSKDNNAVGDLLNGIVIASPYDQFVQQSPTKIVRSVRQINESVINSWKNFNALDYYEAVKNKGPIINLCGMNDRLIIHHRDAIFITRSKATIDTDITQITLGTGDIFQFEPNEVRPARLGYGGTSNPFACMLTPIGYVYADNITGEMFMFDGTALVNIGVGLLNFLLKYLTIKEINNFVGNGIIIGFEQFYKRLLVTVKNVGLTGNDYIFVPNYEPTAEFFATLTANESVVYKDGRYQLFKGENSSEFACSTTDYPSIGNYSFNSDEHKPNGTVIGTVTASGGVLPYTYIITTVDKAGLGVDPLTGQIKVINTAAFDYTRSVLALTVKVTDANGNTDTGIVSVTINQVDSIPVLPAYSLNIPEHSGNGFNVILVHATDRDGKAIVYSITGGNIGSAFTINSSTGQITIATDSAVDYFTNPNFVLIIRATASNGSYTENTVSINLTYVFQEPSAEDTVLNTSVGAADGDEVGDVIPASQRSGQVGNLLYALVTDSTPAGAFDINLDSTDVDFLKVTVLDHTKLATVNNPYNILLKVYNELYPSDFTTFYVRITCSDLAKNTRQAQVFTKECTTGYHGTPFEYVVAANTYSAATVEEANDLALADIATNGQNAANVAGTCFVDNTKGSILIDYYPDAAADFCFYVKTTGLAETDQIVAATANGGPLLLPNDGTLPAACFILSSDKLSPGPPTRRFGVNLAYFVQKYTGIITEIEFEMRGRSDVSKVQGGTYVLRDITMGNWILTDYDVSSKIPAIPTGSTIGLINYSGNIAGGADGSVGRSVGSPVLTIKYNFTTNIITHTTY